MDNDEISKTGTTESEVSEVGFGACGIGGNQWQGGQDDESLRALKRAFELRVNFVDTALAILKRHRWQRNFYQ
jgi:aryl-alcohol dehydrogenase-like predicted oxidoreductase